MLEAIGLKELDRYLARKSKRLQPRTVNRHLNLLHALFKAAQGRELVRSNPVSAVDRPREPRRRWTILTPVEVGRVERAFAALADEAMDEEHVWREQARIVFLTVVSNGLRRGEILGLRWRDVSPADPAGATLRVRETCAGTSKRRSRRRPSGRSRLAGSPPSCSITGRGPRTRVTTSACSAARMRAPRLTRPGMRRRSGSP